MSLANLVYKGSLSQNFIQWLEALPRTPLPPRRKKNLLSKFFFKFTNEIKSLHPQHKKIHTASPTHEQASPPPPRFKQVHTKVLIPLAITPHHRPHPLVLSPPPWLSETYPWSPTPLAYDPTPLTLNPTPYLWTPIGGYISIYSHRLSWWEGRKMLYIFTASLGRIVSMLGYDIP